MFSSFFWSVRVLARKLWVRATIISALAIFAAALSPLSQYLPWQMKDAIDESALRDLLEIITNSMLAVTTFSLSIMVTAHLSADKGVTPRSHRLLQEDGRTQTVLATFIGAFVYALTLTVIINADLIVEADYAVIYIVTVGVIVVVVVAIMRWIAHLDGLGSVEVTSQRVEERVAEAIERRNAAPFLGGRAFTGQVPAGAAELHASCCGYVQTVQMDKLLDMMRDQNCEAFLAVSPGDWVAEGQTLCHISGATLDEDGRTELRAAFPIGDMRIWDQDPAFGLIVLTEIGERALSPGINDPRTGIDTATRLTKLIARLQPEREPDEVSAPLVHVRPFDTAAMMHSTLDRIARDGRAFVEVQCACQRSYAALMHHPDPSIREAAMTLSRRALAYAADGLTLKDDLRRVLKAAPARHPAATFGKSSERDAFNDLEKTGEDQQRGSRA